MSVPGLQSPTGARGAPRCRERGFGCQAVSSPHTPSRSLSTYFTVLQLQDPEVTRLSMTKPLPSGTRPLLVTQGAQPEAQEPGPGRGAEHRAGPADHSTVSPTAPQVTLTVTVTRLAKCESHMGDKLVTRRCTCWCCRGHRGMGPRVIGEPGLLVAWGPVCKACVSGRPEGSHTQGQLETH